MMPMHSASLGYSSYSNSAASSPSAERANSRQEFDFSGVTIPPRLKDFGRKISQMSDNFLPPGSISPEEKSNPSPPPQPVPFMGDDPVMCPFCNKPLPPSLLAAQLAAHTQGHAQNQRVVRRPDQSRPSASRRVSMEVQSRSATPRGPSPRGTPQQTLLDPLPVSTPSQPVPKTTSEELEPTVREADTANHLAAETIISEDEIKRWSTFTGQSLPSLPASSTTEQSAPPPPEVVKPFPLIPPPPGPAKLTKPPPVERQASATRFGFFGKSKDDDDESDDDGAVAGGGYSRLTAPGSPTDDEDESGSKSKKAQQAKAVDAAPEEKPVVESASQPGNESITSTPHVDEPVEIDAKKTAEDAEEPPAKSGEAGSASDAELRKVLQEVLGRVNQLTKSHNDLLGSHSTLLTSLKIARSNLAMAEANTEMLEAQVKRNAASAIASPAPQANRAVSGPTVTPRVLTPVGGITPKVSTPVGGATPKIPTPSERSTPTVPVAPVRASADHVRAATSVTSPPTKGPPVAGPSPKRISLDEKRPTTLHLTANDLLNSGTTGPHSASASGDASKSWGFWNGGKKKMSGALQSVHVPSPAAVMAALPSSRPGTPLGEKSGFDIGSWIPNSPSAASAYSAFSPIDAPRSPQVRNHPSTLSRSMVEQPTLSRSVSQHVVSKSKPGSMTSASGATAQVPVTELSRLRQAYSAAVAKMDGMSKELGELKKGKVEMEAELENLSQALFEEANKMVADERRKKAELEEMLKEVKDEREVLKQTIKVLGGRVEEEERASMDVGRKPQTAGSPAAEFAPRDLDKHYEALRKAVHHVADGATGEDDGNAPAAAEVDLSLSPSISAIIEPPPTSSGFYASSSIPDLESIREGEGVAPSIPGLSVSLPAETNPWAASGPATKIAMTITTPSPIPEAAALAESDSGDTAGEGEEQAPAEVPAPQPIGLGLALDPNVGKA